MDLADLRTFECVARLSSMNRAACELHTVQSNVTSRIRALEQDIGVTLFRRHARGVSMTPAGQRLLPFVSRLDKMMAEARTAAADDGIPQGTLSLGALETTAAWRLSPLLSRFTKACPKVRLTLTTGTTGGLASDVVDCRLDGALIAGPIEHADLTSEVVFQEELVLITSLNVTTLAALREVEDLKTIVFRIGCSYRQRLEAVLAESGLITATPLEFGSLDAILACVAANIGITMLPRSVAMAARDYKSIRLHELPPERSKVDTIFIRRRDAYVSSGLMTFIDHMRSFVPLSLSAA